MPTENISRTPLVPGAVGLAAACTSRHYALNLALAADRSLVPFNSYV